MPCSPSTTEGGGAGFTAALILCNSVDQLSLLSTSGTSGGTCSTGGIGGTGGTGGTGGIGTVGAGDGGNNCTGGVETQAVSRDSHVHSEEHLCSDPVVCQLLHHLDDPGHASNAV